MAFLRRRRKNMMATKEIQMGEAGTEVDNEAFEEDIAFSADRGRVAYVMPCKNGYKVVIDGIEGDEYDEVGPPVFSPDNKHVAYAAMRGDKCLVVIDGVEGKEYDGIYTDEQNITFSPDGKRLAYLARRDNKMFLVVNREEDEI
jgi:hypothetical protein